MEDERNGLRLEENCQTHIPFIALEGVGGSGKSHDGEELNNIFEKCGFQVLTAKVSGLGDSERVRKLKEINNKHEQFLQEGVASSKIIEDKRKDRIFRLATRHQIHLLLKDLKGTKADIGILDRTPIMSWVYASASDSSNPYLDEILREGINQTGFLGISKIYYLQVTPEVAYSRIIARACVSDSNPEQRTRELCGQIDASPESIQQIVDGTLNLISSYPELKPKVYTRWDFIPYQVMAGECERYVEVLQVLSEQKKMRYMIVDAQRPMREVVDNIIADIKANKILQNF